MRLQPDVVVLDISMPLLNGIDAAREIRKALPETRLVFLSMHTNAVYLRKALEAGGSGYVLKSGAAEELLSAIREARKGNIYVSPAFGQNVLDDVRSQHSNRPGSTLELTDRQRQILQRLPKAGKTRRLRRSCTSL